MAVSNNVRTNNTGNPLLHVRSVTPVDSDKSTCEKISECLAGLEFEVHESSCDTPGARSHIIIGKYNPKKATYAFVDISDESRDRGIVYISAIKERMQDLEKALSKTLGVQFAEMVYNV